MLGGGLKLDVSKARKDGASGLDLGGAVGTTIPFRSLVIA